MYKRQAQKRGVVARHGGNEQNFRVVALSNDAFIAGEVDQMAERLDVDDFLAVSQLVLIPSYFKGESFPLVLIQSFMVEVPVIATRIGEIERMMTLDSEHKGGILIDLKDGKVDPEDLTEAIIKMVTDQNFYDECKNSVRLLKERFDIKNVAKNYLALYKRVLD